MSRYAIGYAAEPEEAERPAVVFMEAPAGVWMLRRGEPAPRVFDQPIFASGASGQEVVPGEQLYFDVVLDSFSTSWIIRTVLDMDPPELIASMLMHGDEAWEALPGVALPA